MPTVICPECDADVFLEEDVEEGYVLTCEECGTDLAVISIDPLEVDVYDGELEDFDDDEFDDEKDDDDDEDDDDFDDYDGYGEDEDSY